MEQPVSLRWQTPVHVYTARLLPDLFGGWVLVTTSGIRGTRAGRLHQRPLDSYAEGLDALRRLRRRRRREGCELCVSGFSEFTRLDPHGADVRGAEASALLRLFDVWGVAGAEQATLLAVEPPTLDGYLDGRPLADDPALLSRANDLLAIHKVLRLRYANRPEVIREWLRSPCGRLDGRSPLAVLLAAPEGLAALRRQIEQEADRLRSCPGG